MNKLIEIAKANGAKYIEKYDELEITPDQLRAIIEQHKQDVAEPVEYQIKILGERWTHCAKHIYDPKNPNTRALYTNPHPNIVAELVKALEDDAYAATFQSMAGYRTALIAKAKGMMG